jgi:protein SCO1/2
VAILLAGVEPDTLTTDTISKSGEIMRRNLAVLVALLFGMVGLAACQPYEFKGTLLDPPKSLNDFTLDQHDGRAFHLSDYAGQYVLVYFGYTYCPDACPATLFQAKRAFELLGDDANRVQMVMATVDPGRDSAEVLDKYVTAFNPRFIGLRTDDPAVLDPILAEFGAYYEIDPAEASTTDYLVSHTASLFLVNPAGELAEVFTYGATGEDIAADIQHLLK